MVEVSVTLRIGRCTFSLGCPRSKTIPVLYTDALPLSYPWHCQGTGFEPVTLCSSEVSETYASGTLFTVFVETTP